MDRYSHIAPMFLSLNVWKKQQMTESEIFNLKSQNLSLSGRGIKCQILVLKQKVTHWTASSAAKSHLLMCLTVGRTTVVRSGLGWLMLGPQMTTLNQEPNVPTLWVRADERVRNLLHLRTNDGGLSGQSEWMHQTRALLMLTFQLSGIHAWLHLQCFCCCTS